MPAAGHDAATSQIDLDSFRELQERRRMDREPTQIYTPDEDEVAKTGSAVLGNGGVKPLAIAGIIAAVEDLDRLTSHAREEASQAGQEQTDKKVP